MSTANISHSEGFSQVWIAYKLGNNHFGLLTSMRVLEIYKYLGLGEESVRLL